MRVRNRGDMKKPKQILRKAPLRALTTIVVRTRAVAGAPHLARLHAGQVVIPAAIGKTGLSRRKKEGDGASPVGSYRLAPPFFRPDRVNRILTSTMSRPLDRSLGWCDDPASRLYNRPLPAGARQRHEKLWRTDNVYDVVIPTSHNQCPRVLGAGSAIFLHLARQGYAPTEGCVAISLPDMRRLLRRLSRAAKLVIAG